jgi:transposase-like protein
MFNDYINFTVNFEIICPKCGPKLQKIKKNGHDIKLTGKPQIFYCKICNKSFFAHTSWIFKEFTNLVIEKVVDSLFIDNLDPKSISKIMGISSSTITKIRYQCFDLLSKKFLLYDQRLKMLKNLKIFH